MFDSVKPTQICVQNPIFGPRNLGHYFGSMKDLIKTQYTYNSVVVIDDIMATFMNPRDHKAIRNRSFFVVQDFVNSGFDVDKNNIVLTSQLLPKICELILLLINELDHKYTEHLYENSFMGGLKSYQRKDMELSIHPSVFEMIYPQFGMPAISLGLDVELFQGGEEIMGYTYIMDEIVGRLKDRLNIHLHAPTYEPSQNGTVLGLDGKYMFQHNTLFLSEDEESLSEKIDQITDKRVLIDWLRSLGYSRMAKDLMAKDHFDFEKISLKEILLTELKPFRENKLSNSRISEILTKSKYALESKLNERIKELRSTYLFPDLSAYETGAKLSNA